MLGGFIGNWVLVLSMQTMGVYGAPHVVIIPQATYQIQPQCERARDIKYSLPAPTDRPYKYECVFNGP